MKMTKYLLASTILLGASVLGGAQALAEEGTLPAERETEAQVKFVEDDSQTDPVDPTDPDTDDPTDPVDPTDPDDPVDPGTGGPLSLDFASVLDFGEQKISTKTETYYAAPQYFRGEDGQADLTNPKPLYAQVTDKRGAQKGWTLSVKQNGQFVSNTNKTPLTGAEITFTSGEAVSNSDATLGTVQKEFSLSPDGTGAAENVVAAAEGEGFGTWVYRFGESAEGDYQAVSLNVPGSTVKEKDTYTTSLTWTLNDVPTNDDGSDEGNPDEPGEGDTGVSSELSE